MLGVNDSDKKGENLGYDTRETTKSGGGEREVGSDSDISGKIVKKENRDEK